MITIPQQHTSRIGSCIWSADGDDDDKDDNGDGHNVDNVDDDNGYGGGGDYNPSTARITSALVSRVQCCAIILQTKLFLYFPGIFPLFAFSLWSLF